MKKMYQETQIRYIHKPRLLWPTRFYPQYTSGLDYVSYVSPVERVAFQKVLPRYMLSTSQTRDTGLGPLLERIQYFSCPEEVEVETEFRKTPGEKHRLPYRRHFQEYLTNWHIDVQV
jgi:hypothetical protein